MDSACRKTTTPASVSARPRPAGRSNWQPRSRSSSRTWVLTVCTAMSSCAAALDMLSSLSTIQK